MADPASLAQRASELAGMPGARAQPRRAVAAADLIDHEAVTPATPFVFELTVSVRRFCRLLRRLAVTPALHSPLMSVTNAVSSVIIVGALIAAGPLGLSLAKIMALRVTLAAVNIFGGFIVTTGCCRCSSARSSGRQGPS